ncbi:MAG TPA: GNAT family N-acetyltransferase [Ktedonobacteraceae bacterium]|nr:GNAT family N-acetyltransferase [Ktedonobacteraceae bacterium]
MIVLETSRLFLRHLTFDDLGVLIALYSDPVVMTFRGGIRSPEQTASYLQS